MRPRLYSGLAPTGWLQRPLGNPAGSASRSAGRPRRTRREGRSPAPAPGAAPPPLAVSGWPRSLPADRGVTRVLLPHNPRVAVGATGSSRWAKLEAGLAGRWDGQPFGDGGRGTGDVGGHGSLRPDPARTPPRAAAAGGVRAVPCFLRSP